jgi:hypothetical protein
VLGKGLWERRRTEEEKRDGWREGGGEGRRRGEGWRVSIVDMG